MEQSARKALIDAVLNAVDGSYSNADEVVHKLVDDISLTSKEVNAIMAAFLMKKSDSRCVRSYGNGHGHDFLKQFGAKAPSYSLNQLHSNGLGQYFHEKCIAGRGLLLDETLSNLFCELFGVKGDWSTTKAGLTYIDQKQIEYVVNLKKQIQNKRLVVMTGLGVTLGLVNDSRLTWAGLLNEIRKMLNERVPDIIPDNAWVGVPEERAHLLDQIVKAYFAHLDYRQFVSVIMRDVVPPFDHPLAVAISNLKLPIATTNYDLALDQSLHRFEKNLSNVAIRFSAQHHHEFVYHVHGVWFDSDSVVLSNGDYERTQYEFDYAIGKLFFDSAGSTQHRSLLFVGSKYGMVDAHFSALYTDPRYTHLCHFALLKTQDIADLMDNPEFRNAVRDGRLLPIKYGDHHTDLQNFLEKLIV